MYKVIILVVLSYMLIGITVFCLTIKRELYVAVMGRGDWRDVKDPLNLLYVDDYCFAGMVGVVWPLFLMVVVGMRTGKWLWDVLLSKIVLNSVKRELEKENQK